MASWRVATTTLNRLRLWARPLQLCLAALAVAVAVAVSGALPLADRCDAEQKNTGGALCEDAATSSGEAASAVARRLPALVENLVMESVRERWKARWAGGRELEKRLAASRKQYNFSISDMVGQICFHTAFFKEAGAGYVLATDANIAAYLRACRAVYPTVADEVRHYVERLWREGNLQPAVRERVTNYPPTTPKSCGAPWRQKTREELREELGADADPYFREGLRPLKERTIELSEVVDAFKRGEVARIDARKFLPQELFNYTLQDLREQHKETAHDIPVFVGENHGMFPRCHAPLEKLPDLLQKFGVYSEEVELAIRAVIPWTLDNHCNKSHKLDDVARVTSANLEVPFDYYYDQPEETKALWRHLSTSLRVLGPSAVNLRRLPNFKGSSIDFIRLLGLEEVASTSHNFLWLSMTRGQFHADVYDNIFMHLTEVADLQAFPANCSRLLNDRVIEANQGTFTLLRQGVPKGQSCAPLFHMRLQPGEGAIIPSGAYHKVIARTDGRISMNAFFEPRFRKMQWPSNPANFYGRNHPDVLATRSLWLKVVSHLWTTQRRSMFFHTARMEVI